MVRKDAQTPGAFGVVPDCKVSVRDFNFLDLNFLNNFMRAREVFSVEKFLYCSFENQTDLFGRNTIIALS